MNKKLLALAVAAAFTAPLAAQADVKVYGKAQVEYNIEDREGGDSVQSVDDDGARSRIGIKWSEKLGGGLTAFGKAEWAIDPADHGSSGASDSLRSRDQHVGLKGGFGKIAFGSFHAPYKTAGGVKWDPFTATHLQARRAGGMSGGAGIGGTNGFMRNAIYYTSPKMGGLKVQVAISPDETAAGGTENISGGDNDYSIAVHWKNGPIHAVFAHNRNNNPGDDETLTKVGLRFKTGAHTIQGQYEMIEDCDRACTGSAPGGGGYSRVTGGDDGTIYWLNYQFKSGNNVFSASLGNTEGDDNGGPDNDYLAVGVIHFFSKKTRIFGGYTETDSNNLADREAWTVGIRQDF